MIRLFIGAILQDHTDLCRMHIGGARSRYDHGTPFPRYLVRQESHGCIFDCANDGNSLGYRPELLHALPGGWAGESDDRLADVF